MSFYLLQLSHIQIRFRYRYPLLLSISDIAKLSAIRYRYWLVTSASPNTRNASVVSVSSELSFWMGYTSAKGSKTG